MSLGLALGNQITIGGLIGLADLRALAAEGMRAVVNLLPVAEARGMTPEDEGAAVRALGMEYLHVGVPGGDPLSPKRVAEFVEGFGRLPRPVHVHCMSGRRAGIYAAIALGIECGLSGEEAIRQVIQFGFDPGSPEITKFIKNQIDSD